MCLDRRSSSRESPSDRVVELAVAVVWLPARPSNKRSVTLVVWRYLCNIGDAEAVLFRLNNHQQIDAGR